MKLEGKHYNLDVAVFFREPSDRYTTEIPDTYRVVEAFESKCIVELHFNGTSNPQTAHTGH